MTTLVKRPLTMVVILAVSVLGALALLERGGGDVSGDLAAQSRFFNTDDVRASVGGRSPGTNLAVAAAAQAQVEGGGVVQEHVPPFVTNLVCPILLSARAQVVTTFNALEAAFPNLGPFLNAAEAQALAAIDSQLANFHCAISP
jgi:acetyl esterase/lipase